MVGTYLPYVYCVFCRKECSSYWCEACLKWRQSISVVFEKLSDVYYCTYCGKRLERAEDTDEGYFFENHLCFACHMVADNRHFDERTYTPFAMSYMEHALLHLDLPRHVRIAYLRQRDAALAGRLTVAK